MPKFSEESLRNLETVNPRLRAVFEEVIKTRDCKVLCGKRGKIAQDAAFTAGRSKTPYPLSKHNTEPFSDAIDVVPYPIVWPSLGQKPEELAKNMGRFYLFIGYVLRVAEEMGVHIRCGADWDGDGEIKDQNWDDLPHFELID